MATYDDFIKLDIRVGVITATEDYPPRQIGPFLSEVLTLGVPDSDHECILVVPDKQDAAIGGKLY